MKAVEARLDALGKKLEKTSVKEDVYFCAPGIDPDTVDALRDQLVRIRSEGDGDRVVITAKRRKVESGVETNEEIEITAEPHDDALRLLDYMGYRPFLRKRKESRRYVWGEGVHIELNRLQGLGDFVEIEALLPDHTPGDLVERKRGELRSLLASLGVDESRIEPRPYVDLLRERNVGRA